MDAYGHANPAHDRTSHLTRLYSDVKKSADTNLNSSQPADQLSPHFQRKYRTQRDRLISWGLSWSDDEKGGEGNIDDSVARAGLTETVDSVLRNIKEVTEEAERIRLSSRPAIGSDNKAPLQQTGGNDEARYEDLLRELTTSIDILYDLSMSRRAIARGEHPSFEDFPTDLPDLGPEPDEKGTLSKAALVESQESAPPEFTPRDESMFGRMPSIPYSEFPARIDISAVRLSAESPPPYESNGVPTTTRMVASLIRSRVPHSIQSVTGSSASEIPVLVEYANFDSIYRDTHVPPPLQRLEALSLHLRPMRPESQTSLSLLGFFEDPHQPRLGLVYDVPYAVQNQLRGSSYRIGQNLSPVSLLKTIQKSRKNTLPSDENSAPPLESRYQLALRLAEQLRDLHSQDFYHGNINSSSVLFAMTSSDSPLLHSHMRAALWTSFDLFSKCSVEGVTLDDNFNIYRHPADAPKDASRDLVTDLRFDLYGLALVLLEVGLWLPVGELYKPKYTIADFKLRVERLWIPKLATKCGSAYMRAVQACLRVADESTTTGHDIQELYDVVLERLRRCCLLDEEDTAMELAPSSSHAVRQPASQAPAAQQLRPLPTTFAPPPSVSNASSSWAVTEDARSVQGLANARGERKRRRQERRADRRFRRRDRSAGRDEPEDRDMVPQYVPPDVQVQAPEPEYQTPIASVAATTSRSIAETRNSALDSFREYKRNVITIQRWWRAYLKDQADLMAAYHSNMTQQRMDDAKTGHTARPRRKEFPQVQLPSNLLEDWHNRIAFQLADLVEKALQGSPESSSIAFTAYGETPESARPTMLVCCKSTAKVKHALKRHFRYDQSLFDVKVKKDEIRRCRKSGRDPLDDIRRSMAHGPNLERAANPDYQSRPVCGASIGAYRDEEHLPPVSFGGIILVDGKPFGMSVHHMLEQDDEGGDDDLEAGDDESDDDDSDTSSIRSFDMSEADDSSTVRPGSVVHDGDNGGGYEGDVIGILPNDFEEIMVTQPALDDAIELDLHVDDDEEDEDSGIDEDHLLSYKLGQIYASSGLKRSARPQAMGEGFRSIGQSLPQEIDWALFELVSPRMHPFNVVRGGSKYNPSVNRRGGDSFPNSIRNSNSLACTKVYCLGRTSGLQDGVISSAMELVKIYGRSTFSASWTVDGGFGVGGDSGAWVISNDDSRVCGHVLACRRGKTYICPMDLLLQDIKATLGAKSVVLPSALPRANSANSDRAVRERSMQKAMERMRVNEGEGGGVVLPASPPDSPPLRPMDHGHYASPSSRRMRTTA